MDSQTSTKTHHSAEAILEHMPVAVAVYDTQDLRLLEANPLFLTVMDRFLDPAWHQGRIIGSPLTDWAHPAALTRLATVFRAVAETGTTYRVGDFAFPTSDGNITYWNWTVQRMEDHDGQGIRLLQTITEVTEHVLARQEAERAQTSLRQTTDIIEEEMLDLTRIEQAKLLFQLAPHDLLSILVQVIESQAVTTRQHDLQLMLDGLQTSDRLVGYFDEERIVQVLSNLISNAIKYSPGGGEIEIGLQHTREKPDEALIWVKDRGIGIPADALPHIFERFYRSGKLDRAMSGLGIGLYLVKEIVTRHGGRVWVESIEGVGSTFYVLLPLDNRQV